MFLSFQEPLEVPGLSLESFLRSAMRQQTGKNLKIWEFHKQLKKATLQTEKFTPAEPGGQLQVIEFKHTTVPCLSQKGLELLHR